VTLKPFFLGGVMHTTGNKPPATLPIKGMHLMKDTARLAQYFGITGFHHPAEFPANSIQAMRLLTVVAKESPTHLEVLSRALWTIYYVEDKDFTTPKGLMEACESSGIAHDKASKYMELSQSAEIKEALKQNTADAVNRGAFGAPTFFVKRLDDGSEEEMFFGSDRFPVFSQLYGLPWDGPFPAPSSKF